jgi:hypothetical protein
MKFGRLSKRADPRTLEFAKYAAALPPPPAQFSSLDQVFSKLGIAPAQQAAAIAELFPMDLNDTIGDCTCAGLAHAVTVFSGKAGIRRVPPTANVQALYYALTGGRDTGCDLLTVLNAWRSRVVKPDEILAFVEISSANHTHIRQAIETFGAVYLGFQVTDQTLDQFNAGQPWTPGSPTGDGHCVLAVGYDAQTIGVLTWGALQQGTWAWWDQCVDEAYAVLPVQAEKPGFAPGFDFNTLSADLALVTG